MAEPTLDRLALPRTRPPHIPLAFTAVSLFSSSWWLLWSRPCGPVGFRRLDSQAYQGAAATRFSGSTETGPSPDRRRSRIRGANR